MNEIKQLLLVDDLGMLFPTIKSTQKAHYGLYKCYCGNIFKSQMRGVKQGTTKSCGCYQIEVLKSNSIKHGLKFHRLYGTWKSMKHRCLNKKSTSFNRYGGRGILICERWLNIENFIEDMYPTFKEGLTLDRINNDGNYELSNCRWATRKVQIRNTKKIWKSNTSGYRGAIFSKQQNKWISKIFLDKKSIQIGTFKTAEEAGYAYDKYVIDNNLEHTTNGLYKKEVA